MRGKFITIEGSEGAGKSTALTFIREKLSKQFPDAVFTREPGGTPIAENIRQVLLHGSREETMQPETELLLMFAGRAQHIGHVIRPALEVGKLVLSDRYIDASYAYQGGGRQLSMSMIETLDQLVVGKLYPDLTLLLDVPVAIGLARTEKRGGQKDRIESEQVDFFERVRKVYLARAKAAPERIKVIDASQPQDQVQSQIEQVLNDFLKSHE
jgi:dTMP kinase